MPNLLIPDASDTPVPLTHHLDELRKRIIVCLITALVFSSAAYFFVDPILSWLAKPVGTFVFTGPTEAFFIHIKIAMGLGGLLALPIWIYQLWKYIGRALRVRERTITLGILPFAMGLFFLGVAIALFLVVPAAMRFLLTYSSPILQPMISLDEYLSFIFWMVLGFGLFFQLPLVIVTLARLGIVNPRVFVNYRKHMLVGIFIGAAFLTPGPDIISQLVLALPSYVLFEISLVIARRMYRGD